jgi:hypothetical protein
MKVKRLIEMLQDVNQETNVYVYVSNSKKGWNICDIELVGQNEDITLLSVPFEDEYWNKLNRDDIFFLDEGYKDMKIKIKED